MLDNLDFITVYCTGKGCSGTVYQSHNGCYYCRVCDATWDEKGENGND